MRELSNPGYQMLILPWTSGMKGCANARYFVYPWWQNIKDCDC